MTERRQRFFAPTSKFDRILYLVTALTCPYTVLALYGRPEMEAPVIIMTFWSVIAIFYTIDWALSSYRGWVSRRASRVKSG